MKKPEKIIISELLDKFKIGINILEPTANNEDFIFLYSNNTFWNYFKKDLNKYLLGRKFSEVLPKINQPSNEKTSLKSVFSSKTPIDLIIKLYQEDSLIKVWSQNKINYKNDLIITLEDLTEFYKEKEKEEKIFCEASFPKIQINNDFKVLKLNKAYHNIIGYSIKELNQTDYSKLILEYDFKTKGVKSFNDGLNKVFFKKEKSFISEVKIITKNESIKYFNIYCRLIDDDTIQIGFHDLTELKQSKKKELNLNNYFKQMQKMNKIALSLRSGNLVKWSPEIYEILEIPPKEDKGYMDNFLYEYVLNEDKKIIKKALEDLSTSNVTRCLFKVETGKNNIKYLKVTFENTYENGEKVIIGFVQDITDEILAQKEAIRLQSNFNLIEEYNKIGIAEYYKGKYTFTSKIYETLGIKPEDYPNDVNIIGEYIIPQDMDQYWETFNFTKLHNIADATCRVYGENKELKYLYIKNKAFFNNQGEINKIVGFIVDVTEEVLTKQSAIELENNLEQIQRYSKIVISTLHNGIYHYTMQIYDILEIEPENCPNNIDLIYYFTAEEEKESVMKQLHSLNVENPKIQLIIKIKTKNGKVKYLEDYIEAEFDDEGNLVKRVGFIHEITPIIEYEKELEELSEERKLLLQELHDRVKNNLQLILSFINIDSYNNKGNDSNYLMEKTKSRIQTMALTHEEVYQSNSLSNVNLKNFLTKNLTNFFQIYSTHNINLILNIEPIELNLNSSIPLGLLLNEFAMNTIKYTFPNNEEGEFYLNVKSNDDLINLKMWDNGIGILDEEEVFNSNSIGFVIIKSLSQQLNGDLSILKDVPGFGLELKFKI